MPFSLMFELQREEAAWLRCAEAERIVLGEALAATREKVADCERRALELIEEAKRRQEAHEAEERRRLEESERRHREYLESIRAASAPPRRPQARPILRPSRPPFALPEGTATTRCAPPLRPDLPAGRCLGGPASAGGEGESRKPA